MKVTLKQSTPVVNEHAQSPYYTNALGRKWNSNFDHRQSDTHGNTKKHIIFVRHGEYVGDDPNGAECVDESFQEDFIMNDKYCVLTPLGREQAGFTGSRLAEILEKEGLMQENGRAIRVFSSDMARAVETAGLIKEKLEEKLESSTSISYHTDSILREGFPGNGDGYPLDLGFADYAQAIGDVRFEAVFRTYVHRGEVQPKETLPPTEVPSDNSDESGASQQSSTEQPKQEASVIEKENKPVDDKSSTDEPKAVESDNPVVKKHPARGVMVGDTYKTVDIVVCHGNLIRFLITRALQIPTNAWMHFPMTHGSYTHFEVHSNGWISALSIGDKGGMPVDKVTR
ncbi:Serine/threonine-protein phosphatase pgam5, mitochondrial [Globomyces sp. JEL0801]|nr:Serine/threonine-protein phosphatase pgam5, mitochondrial [Globomyces sp. JEL0801]